MEDKIKQSHQDRIRVFGVEHPETAASLSYLGLIARAKGNLPEAKELLDQAQKINSKSFGDSHPTTATSFMNLGLLLVRAGDVKRGMNMLRKAKSASAAVSSRHPYRVDFEQMIAAAKIEIQSDQLRQRVAN
jgi:tetratricopeptide (TPR) repeat protein